MQLGRLLHPRSVAVVGATDLPGSYAGQTLLNLAALGYPGQVWGVNPGRREAHGVPCFPSLSELESPPDAVVVAIPAAAVPDVIEEAGATGCGGAVVYGAGFGEMAAAAGSESSEAAKTGARAASGRFATPPRGTRSRSAARTATASLRCTSGPCGGTRCGRSRRAPWPSSPRAATWP